MPDPNVCGKAPPGGLHQTWQKIRHLDQLIAKLAYRDQPPSTDTVAIEQACWQLFFPYAMIVQVFNSSIKEGSFYPITDFLSSRKSRASKSPDLLTEICQQKAYLLGMIITRECPRGTPVAMPRPDEKLLFPLWVRKESDVKIGTHLATLIYIYYEMLAPGQESKMASTEAKLKGYLDRPPNELVVFLESLKMPKISQHDYHLQHVGVPREAIPRLSNYLYEPMLLPTKGPGGAPEGEPLLVQLARKIVRQYTEDLLNNMYVLDEHGKEYSTFYDLMVTRLQLFFPALIKEKIQAGELQQGNGDKHTVRFGLNHKCLQIDMYGGAGQPSLVVTIPLNEALSQLSVHSFAYISRYCHPNCMWYVDLDASLVGMDVYVNGPALKFLQALDATDPATSKPAKAYPNVIDPHGLTMLCCYALPITYNALPLIISTGLLADSIGINHSSIALDAYLDSGYVLTVLMGQAMPSGTPYLVKDGEHRKTVAEWSCVLCLKHMTVLNTFSYEAITRGVIRNMDRDDL